MSERYDAGLKFLDAGGDKFSKYRDPGEPDEPEYGCDIPVGRTRTGEVLRIRLDETSRVGVFDKSGNGKTVLCKSLISRGTRSGFKVFHGSDVKNDMQKINRYGGVSKELVKKTAGLLPGEKPVEISRVLAVPNFMVEHYRGDPGEYGTRFSLGFQDISESDFKSLIGFNGFSSAQQDLYAELMSDISLHDTNWKYLIQQLEEMGGRSADAIIRRFNALMGKGVLAPEMRKDIIGRFEDVEVVSLGLKHWMKYYPNSMESIRFYSGVLHRNFVEAVQRKEISGRFIIFNDEFHLMAPDGTPSLVKDEFQNILDLSGRQAEISSIIAAQRPSQLPYPRSDDKYDFLGPLNHIFLGPGLSREDWKTALSDTGLYNPNRPDPWRKKFNQMDKHEFLYVNPEKHTHHSDCRVVNSLAPLCAHPG